jgi:hypothetical protein
MGFEARTDSPQLYDVHNEGHNAGVGYMGF